MGIPYNDVIERMKDAGKLRNDSAVARELNVTPQALSNYKKRGEMPTDLVVRFATMHGLSIDWLITGQGAEALPAPTPQPPDFNTYTPDELIYTGKLLKIMRMGELPSKAARMTLDAISGWER